MGAPTPGEYWFWAPLGEEAVVADVEQAVVPIGARGIDVDFARELADEPGITRHDAVEICRRFRSGG